MDIVDRRVALRTCLLALAAAGAATVLPRSAAAVPLALDKAPDAKSLDLLEDAQVVVVSPRRRYWHGRRRWRGGRRWVCWWRRGRRVCGWRRW
jgi:hypothetical protein